MQRRIVVAGLMLGAILFQAFRCQTQRAVQPVPCPVCETPARFERRDGVWLFWRCPRCCTATYRSDRGFHIEHLVGIFADDE